MVALAAITNMSLHNLKEERGRLEERLSGAEAEMNLAMAEIAMAQAKVTKAKESYKEVKCLMTILDDKIAEMEEVRDSVLEDDEMAESVVRVTRKRGWSGAQPYPARRPQPFGRGVVCQLHCRQCNKPQPPCHSPAAPCVHCQWEPSN